MAIVHRCLKCKTDRNMVKVIVTLAKNGRPMIQGECKFCGATMSRFLPMFERITKKE